LQYEVNINNTNEQAVCDLATWSLWALYSPRQRQYSVSALKLWLRTNQSMTRLAMGAGDSQTFEFPPQ